MAISAQLYDNEAPVSGKYAAVATQSAFRKLWLPPIQRLGLPRLRSFEHGADFRGGALSELQSELISLRKWFASRGGLDDQTLVERIDGVLVLVSEAMDNPSVSLNVG